MIVWKRDSSGSQSGRRQSGAVVVDPVRKGSGLNYGCSSGEGKTWMDLELSLEVSCQGLLRWKVKEREKLRITLGFLAQLVPFPNVNCTQNY